MTEGKLRTSRMERGTALLSGHTVSRQKINMIQDQLEELQKYFHKAHATTEV